MEFRRILPVVLVALAACFSDPPTAGDGTGSSAASESDSGSTSSGESTSAQTQSTTEESETTAETTADSETGPLVCTWDLDWGGTTNKDVVVVVDAAPTNLGALHLRADAVATAQGVHVAIASTCMPGSCGVPEGDGYQAILLDSDADPLSQAAGVVPMGAFFRPFAPRRVVVVTDVDTGWTLQMVEAEPMLRGVQIDVRSTLPGTCGQQPLLEAIAAATHGSYVCGDLEAQQILDDAIVLAPQPACELFGDVAEGPQGGPEQVLELEGTADGQATSGMPDGPTVCANSPEGWTFVDEGLGHLGLCPHVCRDVGNWVDVSASIDYPCDP